MLWVDPVHVHGKADPSPVAVLRRVKSRNRKPEGTAVSGCFFPRMRFHCRCNRESGGGQFADVRDVSRLE